MRRPKFLQKKTSQPKGRSEVMSGMSAAASLEADISEAVVLPASGGSQSVAVENLAGLLRNAGTPRGDDALGRIPGRAGWGRSVKIIEASDGPGAVAALLGLGLSGLRCSAVMSVDALSRARGSLQAAAAQGVPLVIHALLDSQGGSSDSAADALNSLSGCGWFILHAPDAQTAADLTAVARRVAEEALLPGIVLQEAGFTAECLEKITMHEGEELAQYLGQPGDEITAYTPAQRMTYGQQRRRIPDRMNVDSPAAAGMDAPGGLASRAAAARGAFFHGGLSERIARAAQDYSALVGRPVSPVTTHEASGADYLILAQGAAVGTARAVARSLSGAKGSRVGVLGLNQVSPFPRGAVARLARSSKGLLVLDRSGAFPALEDDASGGDAPMLKEMRALLQACLDNGYFKNRGGSSSGDGQLPVYSQGSDAPPLFSALYGAGGEPPSPGALLAAAENMLPGGAGKRTVFLDTPFLRDQAATPKEEIYLQTVGDSYPGLDKLGLAGNRDSAVQPGQEQLSIRICSRGGQGLFTATESPARLLAALKSLHVKVWSDPPQAARGARSNASARLNILASAGDIPGNFAPGQVNITVCTRSGSLAGPLRGLAQEGALILLATPDEARQRLAALSAAELGTLTGKAVTVYALDTAAAQGEALSADEQRTVAGRLLTGALLSLPAVAGLTGLRGKELTKALRAFLPDWHEVDGDNAMREAGVHLEQIQRGGDSLVEVAPPAAPAEEAAATATQAQLIPEVLKARPEGEAPLLDPHRFWEGDVRRFAAEGQRGVLATPFLGAGMYPAATGALANRSPNRRVQPQWLPEKCTGCGACWTVCPDGALPARVNTAGEILQTAQARLLAGGQSAEHLPRAVRPLEGKLNEALAAAGPGHAVAGCIPAAIPAAIQGSRVTSAEKEQLEGELAALQGLLEGVPMAVTEPFFVKNGSGILTIALDPDRCTGCLACVSACAEKALDTIPREEADLEAHRNARDFLRALPDTPAAYLECGDPAEAPGLERRLLSARAQLSGGGGSTLPGASERTLLRLFTAMVESTMQPRVAGYIGELEELIAELEQHIRLNLAVDVKDPKALQKAVKKLGADNGGEFTLAELSRQVDRDGKPVDTDWVTFVTGLLSGLKDLLARYQGGALSPETPRASLAMAAAPATGAAESSWAPAWPFNPFPFPWTALPGIAGAESPALALGLFEGHTERMARGFRLVRQARLEIAGKYNPEIHDGFFARFGWQEFSEDELNLCPPLVLAADDAALNGQGQGALRHLLASGRPVKVLNLDGGSWRSLAGRSSAHTVLPEGQDAPALGSLAGRIGVLSGPLSLLAAPGGGNAFIMQGGLGDLPHLLQGFIDGLNHPGPALFSVYAADLNPDGSTSALAQVQSLLALKSRAHPALRYDPGAGETLPERLTLAGNPDTDEPWAGHALVCLDASGQPSSREITLTFADYAATLPALAHHFSPLPGGESAGVPVVDYLEMDAEEQQENTPYVLAVDVHGVPRALQVSRAVVEAAAERLAAWRMLRSTTREDVVPVDTDAIASQARSEVVDTVWQNLVELARSSEGNGAKAGAGSADQGSINQPEQTGAAGGGD